MEPLASFGEETSALTTNLSRSVSLTVLDGDGNDVTLSSDDDRFHVVIPHDPKVSLPSMVVQNVTSDEQTNASHQLQFNYHFYSLQSHSKANASIHIELQPTQSNHATGYLLIYRFDLAPRLNSSMQEIDGWTLFCPSSRIHLSPIDLTDFVHWIGDEQTRRQPTSIIIGIRELNSTEIAYSCWSSPRPTSPPINDAPFHFTINYAIRMLLSACYYFDTGSQQWRSDGMRVR
jgi:hypothetical protein